MVREKFPKPGREDRDARATEIVDFMSAITHGVQFCVLVTEDEETVGGLFESMNNRGRALNPADLWKNLLSQEGPKENAAEIAEKWDKVFEGVGKSSSNALRFVRTFALAHASFQEIREKKLFDTLKHEGFISRLGGSVRTIDLMIRDLEGLKHMQQDNLPSGAHCELFRDFKSMNPPIAYLPLLLAVDRIEPKETVRLLEGLIDVHLCGRIMGLKPHLIGNHIAELRVALLVSGVEGLRTALKSTIEELAAKALPRFESLRLDGSVASALLVRSLLGRLYWFVENSIERAAGRPSGFHKHYQIEHIFPQGAEADHYNEFMDGVDETTAAALTGNIGNLLLLDGSANAAGGNTRFHIKRKLYRASSAYLNRALVEVIHEGRGTAAARILDGLTVHETWNRDSISIHAADQRRLFERYLKRTY
jgi:hypothetical protein